jgi:hypothetical protein
MADLKRQPRWVRYEPDFANNLEQEPGARFYLEVATALTKEQLADWGKRLADEMSAAADNVPAALARGFEGVVRMGGEPLTVDGAPVATLEAFLALVSGQADAGMADVLDLSTTVRRFNSMEGSRALFFERLSGGSTTTRFPRTGKARSQTAAPQSGASTSSTDSSG